jgi:hypothetical protein
MNSGGGISSSNNNRCIILFSITSACILIGIKWRKLQEIKKRYRKKKEGSVNIGGNIYFILFLFIIYYINQIFLIIIYEFNRYIWYGCWWDSYKNCLF